MSRTRRKDIVTREIKPEGKAVREKTSRQMRIHDNGDVTWDHDDERTTVKRLASKARRRGDRVVVRKALDELVD